MEKVIRDGKVAVLYSPGYGTGWYTENTEHPECVFSPELVELVERGEFEELIERVNELWPNFYAGGAYDLTIAWVPVGHRFVIGEYDGSESVQIIGPDYGLVA